jgi:hypothetical protein
MTSLHPELLDDHSSLDSQGIFSANLKNRELYNAFQFVLRLLTLVPALRCRASHFCVTCHAHGTVFPSLHHRIRA